MSQLTDLSASFVVRIWREPRDAASAPLEWRGSVQCVQCNERSYFKDGAQMLDFMRRHLARIGLDRAVFPFDDTGA
jgi:hypothetical protein